MALKSVAVEGGASAETGSIFFTGADSGSWEAGAVSVQSYDALTVGGTKVIYEASCTFSFTGANSGSGATIEGTEDVTLTAGNTVLQGSGDKVLVDGDASPNGSYGNKIVIAANGPLQTDQG